MAEEPEEVLPQHRTTAARREEGGAEVPVTQEHDDGAPEEGEREHDETGLREDGPREDVEVRPSDVLTALGEDGRDHVDGTECRRDTGEVQSEEHHVHGGTGLCLTVGTRRDERLVPQDASGVYIVQLVWEGWIPATMNSGNPIQMRIAPAGNNQNATALRRGNAKSSAPMSNGMK